MRDTKLPLVRHFSELEGYQTAYTLCYDLDIEARGCCCLTLCRAGFRDTTRALDLPAPPEEGMRLLQYLYENAVQPELWQDVVREFFPLARPAEGGAAGE